MLNTGVRLGTIVSSLMLMAAPALGEEKSKTEKAGANAPLFKVLSKSSVKVLTADVGAALEDPKPDRPPKKRVLPSGTTEVFIAVKFKAAPTAKTIAYQVWANGEPIAVELLKRQSTTELFNKNGSISAYVLNKGIRPESGAFDDGPYQAKVLLDDVAVVELNWRIGD